MSVARYVDPYNKEGGLFTLVATRCSRYTQASLSSHFGSGEKLKTLYNEGGGKRGLVHDLNLRATAAGQEAESGNQRLSIDTQSTQ